MAMEGFLVTDILIHCLQLTCIASSSLLLHLSWKTRMIKNQNLLLMHCLVLMDLLLAVSTLPYVLYLSSHWNPAYILLDPYFVMISSMPLAFQLKVNLVIIIAIAIDRLIALFTPTIYRRTNHKVYACYTMGAALSFGVFDVALEFLMTPFVAKPNCAAIVCYVSDKFKYYWGSSNAIMGIIVILLILVMIIKLKKFSAQRTVSGTAKEQRRFEKANRSAFCTLISSLICITTPSVFAGVSEMIGNSVFRALGPFYLMGLLAAGCVHSISQLLLNRELFNRLKNYVGISINNATGPVTNNTTGPATTIDHTSFFIIPQRI